MRMGDYNLKDYSNKKLIKASKWTIFCSVDVRALFGIVHIYFLYLQQLTVKLLNDAKSVHSIVQCDT